MHIMALNLLCCDVRERSTPTLRVYVELTESARSLHNTFIIDDIDDLYGYA